MWARIASTIPQQESPKLQNQEVSELESKELKKSESDNKNR